MSDIKQVLERATAMEDAAIEFKRRPEVFDRMFRNADPKNGRSREQNTAWAMAAFAQYVTDQNRELIRELAEALESVLAYVHHESAEAALAKVREAGL